MQWYLCQILAKERWDVPLKNWISLVESINSSPWSKLQEHPIFSSSALHRVTSKQASGWHFWSVGVAYPSLAITAHLWHICKFAHCDTSAHCTSAHLWHICKSQLQHLLLHQSCSKSSRWQTNYWQWGVSCADLENDWTNSIGILQKTPSVIIHARAGSLKYLTNLKL